MDAIPIRRKIDAAEKLEYTRHWAAQARANPQWAADQIAGLLQRALDAEAKVDGLRADLKAALCVGGDS